MPLDGEPLSATLIEPKNGSYVRGVEPSGLRYQITRQLTVWNTTMWPDGLYVLEAIAYNGVGNSNQTVCG